MDNDKIKKILLVDDSPVSRRILKSCITRAEQYEFYEADDGPMALEIFKTHRPELTFMDINMPKMNGIDCLAEIRKINGQAVVVMCSAEINPETTKQSLAKGALMVIKKPPTKEFIQEAMAKTSAAL